jgi:hypothetical protein
MAAARLSGSGNTALTISAWMKMRPTAAIAPAVAGARYGAQHARRRRVRTLRWVS